MNVEQEYQELVKENKQVFEDIEDLRNDEEEYYKWETETNTEVQAHYRYYKHFLEQVAEEEPGKVVEIIKRLKKDLKEIPILDIDFRFDEDEEEEE